jgi:hypothetical protein
MGRNLGGGQVGVIKQKCCDASGSKRNTDLVVSVQYNYYCSTFIP